MCHMRRSEQNLEYCSVVECSVGETGTMVVRESPAITVEKMWMAQLYISHRQTTRYYPSTSMVVMVGMVLPSHTTDHGITPPPAW